MIIYVDIDNTICKTNGCNYSEAIPYNDRIDTMNILFEQGNEIIYWTARGTGSGKDYSKMTIEQLNKWEVKYTDVLFNKPVYDLFIDDRNINSYIYFNR